MANDKSDKTPVTSTPTPGPDMDMSTTETKSVDLANEGPVDGGTEKAAEISEAQQDEQGESYDPNSDPVMVSSAVAEHVATDLAVDGSSPTLDEYRDQAKQSDTNEPGTA